MKRLIAGVMALALAWTPVLAADKNPLASYPGEPNQPLKVGDEVPVAHGGTGLVTLTSHCVVVGQGTSAAHLVCPSTSGLPLTSAGASADPAFAAVACGALPALTGDVTTSAGACVTAIGANKVALGSIAQIGANAVLGNATGSTANVAAQAMPSCSTASSALIWTTSTGFGCNSIAATVTHAAGALTSGQLVIGNGAADIKVGDLTGDVTTSGATATTIAANAVTTSKINDSAVTLAKIANAAASSKLLGSGATGSGAPYVEITLGANLSMTGNTLNTAGAVPTFIGCAAYHNTTQNVANATITYLALNSSNYDTSGIHSNVTNNSRLTIPAGMGGYWRFSYNSGVFQSNGTNQRILFLRKNGTTTITGSEVAISGGSALVSSQLASTITLSLAAGDYVELGVFQSNSGGSTLTVGGAGVAAAEGNTYFECQYVGT